MNSRKLTFLFLVLLGIWGIAKNTFKHKTNSFKTDLIRIDTAQVDIIMIDHKGEAEMILQRNTTAHWIATKGTVMATANREAVTSFLNNIHLIKTEGIAAKKKEKWSQYAVDEANGTRIKIYAGSRLLEDFIVGRFNLNKETNKGFSYVRISDGEEVYAIEGLLSQRLGQEFNAYRNKDLIKVVEEDITSLSLASVDGTMKAFSKLNNVWTNNDGVVVDSIEISHYLSGIQHIMGSKFVDDIESTTYNIPKYKTLVIRGNSMLQPVTITCYRNEARIPPYIIQSSQNLESYFSSQETELFQKIFGALEML